jgi:predicted AlkP superfamily pyrophosphatase or phosphodiesterase
VVTRFVAAALAVCLWSAADAAPVVLISIDGLHPDYVTHADRHGLAIPHLRSFVDEGAYADGVVGVLPTVTFPSHTTLVTGVSPAEHGIASNTPFDPLNGNRDGWFWYADDVRVPTLWTRAKERGLRTASVNWSVTVGDRAIDYLIPEMWRAVNDEDVKLLRALSRPEGLVERLEEKLGTFVNGYEDTVEADRVRTDFALAILREQRPDLMAVHLIALDGFEHRDGPYVPSVFATLEALDRMIGELGAAAVAHSPDAIVAVVSDHGFIATHTAVNLRVPFVAAGLIRLPGPFKRVSPRPSLRGMHSCGRRRRAPPSCCAIARTRGCERALLRFSKSLPRNPRTASRKSSSAKRSRVTAVFRARTSSWSSRPASTSARPCMASCSFRRRRRGRTAICRHGRRCKRRCS